MRRKFFGGMYECAENPQKMRVSSRETFGMELDAHDEAAGSG